MQKITFVTGNKGKIATAQQYLNELNIKLETYDYDIIEPQSDKLTEIAKSKVTQAYKIVNQPCIANDSGFYIEALNGFPSVFVRYALDTIGVEGILKLMDGVEPRTCMFKECLAYYDGTSIEYFHCEHVGTLSDKILGNDNPEKWSDLWYVFIPDYSTSGRTLAQYTIGETQERRKHIDSSLKRFAKWYKKQLTPSQNSHNTAHSFLHL